MSLGVRVTVMGSLADEIRRQLEARMIDLHGRLVLKSPVDEGVFRAAWEVDPAALTIGNHTEYADALARGHSPQARDGWIEAEIDNVFRL